MNAVITTSFDYTALPPKTAETLRAAVSAIRTVQRSAVIEVGDRLIAAKAALGHGAFGAWLNAEFQMSERTAQNYMNAAKFLPGKSAKFALLPPSAIYALAAPPEVVAEVQAEVEAGAVPQVAEIRERIDGFARAARAAAAVKTAEQVKLEKEKEKWRRAAQVARELKEKVEREEAEKLRDDRAEKVARVLVSRIGGAGVVELLALLTRTDWYRVERHFRRPGGLNSPLSAEVIDTEFKADTPQ